MRCELSLLYGNLARCSLEVGLHKRSFATMSVQVYLVLCEL